MVKEQDGDDHKWWVFKVVLTLGDDEWVMTDSGGDQKWWQNMLVMYEDSDGSN